MESLSLNLMVIESEIQCALLRSIMAIWIYDSGVFSEASSDLAVFIMKRGII